jgi:hypothetical protein
MAEYQKSSCNCYDCNKKNYLSNTSTNTTKSSNIPTNLGILKNDNSTSNYLDCYYEQDFKSDIEPNYLGKTKYTYLNPQAMTQKYATDFNIINCQQPIGCNDKLYISNDPRLIDSPRADMLLLDTPPIDSNLKLNTIYTDKNLDTYSKKYNTYTDINTGQIMYYIDESIANPFFNPNFVTSSYAESKMYKDPMGAYKPRYERYPITYNDPITTDNQNYNYTLAWMQDTTSYREDIMAKQMRKRMEQRWEPRWDNLNQ